MQMSFYKLPSLKEKIIDTLTRPMYEEDLNT
jgi:hypothetical protein